jgi:mono/diheme cytochrome c family protein
MVKLARLLFGFVCVLTPLAPATIDAPSVRAGAIDRGRYLVESVAMCVQCHTPRDADGRLMTARSLMGDGVWIANPFARTPWASWAPRISGLPGYTKEQGIRLLTEGIARDGATPKLPMPPFRMAREDAEAVVSYLMSHE